MSKESTRPARICIGVVSRDRREMVGNLLESIAGLKRASDFLYEIVLVENGPIAALSELATEFRKRVPNIQLHYIHESNIGVVYARNAALNFAITQRFDKLAFVDDDEVVDPEWLLNLHAAQAEQQVELIGGPVRPFVRIKPENYLQKIMWKSYQCRSRRVERVSNHRHTKGHGGNITLATNNWMLDLARMKNKSLRFDLRYNLSGGEDTAFFSEMKKAGSKTGWAKDAIVREEIPLQRLAVRYQFNRSRDQSLVSFHRKYENKPVKKWVTVPLGVIYKLFAAAVMLVITPFTLGNTLLSAIRAFGAAMGRLAGLKGQWTQHYEQTTGH